MSDIVERKVSGFTVKIERPNYIGSRNCVNAVPDLFELDNEQICAFKDNTEGMEREVIIEVCSVCPVSALHVLDESGKQIVP